MGGVTTARQLALELSTTATEDVSSQAAALARGLDGLIGFFGAAVRTTRDAVTASVTAVVTAAERGPAGDAAAVAAAARTAADALTPGVGRDAAQAVAGPNPIDNQLEVKATVKTANQ